MSDWEDYIGHRRETFINEMVTRGFRLMPFSSSGASKYGILKHVDLWFTNNDLGWPDDPPALDLEAYLAGLPIDPRYIVRSQIACYTGDFIVLHTDHHVLRVHHAGRVPKKSRKPIPHRPLKIAQAHNVRNPLYGLALDRRPVRGAITPSASDRSSNNGSAKRESPQDPPGTLMRNHSDLLALPKW